MKNSYFKSFIALLILSAGVWLTACESGTEDKPFVLGEGGGKERGDTSKSPPPAGCKTDGECGAGKVCKSGSCVPGGGVVTECKKDEECKDGKVCKEGKCVVKEGPVTCTPACSDKQKCEAGVCNCDPAKTPCAPPTGACSVEFSPTLVLKIDDQGTTTGHYDSPAACKEYAGPKGSSTATLDPKQRDQFLQDPSDNRDLYCCATIPAVNTDVDVKKFGKTLPSFVDSIFCQKDNRHDGQPELAVTRWRPNGKALLKFDISGDGTCRVFLNTDSFPKYSLENTAIDASLVIDAGKDYQKSPKNLGRRLNDAEAIGTCRVSDKGGAVEVAIDNLPLRFFVQIFKSQKKCLDIDERDSPDKAVRCPAELFKARYNGESAGSYQIIPGFGETSSPISPLSLTTGKKTQAPVDATVQKEMTITGIPLHFDATKGESRLSLVTAFSMPPLEKGEGTTRNDVEGTGQLLQQLGSAILTAELSGPVTRQKGGKPIKTLADLTTDCGGGGGDGSKKLNLSMRSSFDGSPQPLVVSGNPENPGDPFSAEVLLPSEAAKLPFAKGAGDPVTSGIEDRFVKNGKIEIDNERGSTESVKLEVPAKTGPFRVMNASSLKSITLAPDNGTTLEVQFEPDSGDCKTVGDRVNCESELSISSSHNIKIRLKGQAKLPKAELVLEEIKTSGPSTPGVKVPSLLDFKEATAGAQTITKLIRISNSGVRDLEVTGLRTEDKEQNFRIGSIYSGRSFEERKWKVGEKPWKISPAGTSDLFFFLSYGPFGKVTDKSSKATCGIDSPQPTRCDKSTLVISTDPSGKISAATVTLSGKATLDTRAVVELYIQDEYKKTEAPAGFAGKEKLILAKRPLETTVSLRQDPAKRALYLRNGNGDKSQLDSLVLTSLKLEGTSPDKFKFTISPAVKTPLALKPNEIVKVGEIEPASTDSASFVRFFAALKAEVSSRPSKPGEADRSPVVGGYLKEDGTLDRSRSQDSFSFRIGRAAGAMDKTRTLKIHRLFGGFDQKLIASAPSRVVSSTTGGIAKRAGLDPTTYEEIYTVKNGIAFDPVAGTATLNPIWTVVNDKIPNSSDVTGIRLFNGQGSSPPFQYQFQCDQAAKKGKASCGFFYIYIGDWSSTGRLCDGKPPISATPDDSKKTHPALDPRIPGEMDCIKDKEKGLVPSIGVYDPVTGEITFPDLAIRLFSPNTPALSGGQDVDAVIRVSLTTDCLTADLVPDDAARPNRLVPKQTREDGLEFVTDRGFKNPFTFYTGGACSNPEEFHGRRLGEPLVSEILDNEGLVTLSADNFDLAGIGKIRAGDAKTKEPITIANKMLWLVISVEAK